MLDSITGRAMFGVCFAVMGLMIRLFSGGSGSSPAATRLADINTWKLMGTEIAAYDACRTALGHTRGAVAQGSYCGCLVVSGANTLHNVAAPKLQPLLIANYTANYKATPASAGHSDPAWPQVESSVELASPGCRTPRPSKKREAQYSIAGQSYTASELREMARRQAEDDYNDRRELPLLADN